MRLYALLSASCLVINASVAVYMQVSLNISISEGTVRGAVVSPEEITDGLNLAGERSDDQR